MRKIIIAVAASLLLAAPGVAAAGEILPGSPRAALAAELIAKERDGWRFYKDKNVEALTAFTSDDFADLYSGGEVVDRKQWLADMQGVTVERSQLSKFHVFELADDAVLLTYDGEAWGHDAKGRKLHNHAAVTSAWARRGGRWLHVFYGETALDAASKIVGGKPVG